MLNNHSKHSPKQVLHSPECDTFTHDGVKVKIITVFTDKKHAVALVENEEGEIFEVPRDSIR